MYRCPKCEIALTTQEAAGPICPVCQSPLPRTSAEPTYPEQVEKRKPSESDRRPFSGPTPHFTAMAVFACKKNRLYRVYVRPDELVCIWAGSAFDSTTAAQAGIHGGAVGALVGYFIAQMLNPAKKNAARKQVLDTTPLEELIDDNAMNLRATIGDFEDARFVAPSRFKNPTDKAVLLMRHRTVGQLHLGFSTVEDAQVAMRELPPLLGDACRIEIEWSEKKKGYVKKRA